MAWSRGLRKILQLNHFFIIDTGTKKHEAFQKYSSIDIKVHVLVFFVIQMAIEKKYTLQHPILMMFVKFFDSCV